MPGDDICFHALVAYPLDLFEEGSVVDVLTSLVGNVFGFKALPALRLEDIRFPLQYVMTCGGAPNGMLHIHRAITCASSATTTSARPRASPWPSTAATGKDGRASACSIRPPPV